MTRAETIRILEKRCGKPTFSDDYYPVFTGYVGTSLVKYKVLQHGIIRTQLFGSVEEYTPFNELTRSMLVKPLNFYACLVDLKKMCKKTECEECRAKQWCDVFCGAPCDWKLETISGEYR